jgi:hypothetical protein
MAIITREVKESPIAQGVEEQIAYRIDVAPWGSAPTDVDMVVLDESAGFADVTGSVTTGAPGVVGDVITLPLLHSLELNHVYFVEALWTAGGQRLSAWARVYAIR